MFLLKKYSLLVLVLLCTLSSCKKDEEEDVNDGDLAITADLYFTATINGEKVLLQDGVGFYGNGMTSSSSGGSHLEQGSVFQNAFSNPEYSQVSFSSSNFTGDSGCEKASSLFKKGSYDFSTSDEDSNGAAVYYQDTEGVDWSTTNGVQPSTSTLTITSIETDATNQALHKIEVTFNCTLFDEDGNSMLLSNGKMAGRFGLCY